jgi:hypothetical protein
MDNLSGPQPTQQMSTQTPENRSNYIGQLAVVNPAPLQSNAVKYTAKHRVLLFAAPPALAIIANFARIILDKYSGTLIVTSVAGVLGVVCFLYGYIAQTKYIKASLPKTKPIEKLYLPLLCIILVTMAVIIANNRGNATYGITDNNIPAWFGLILGFETASILAYISAIGSELVILTHFTNKFFRIFNKIVYLMGYLFVGLMTYFVYAIVYSLHDPSTE